MVPKALEAAEPTLLDRAIGVFSPKTQLQRMQARYQIAAGSQLSTAYQGARGRGGALQEWTPDAGDPDSQIVELQTLRLRSRDLFRNDSLSHGAVSSTVTSVVGTGLAVKPQLDRNVLGLSEEEADAWERRAKSLFRWWAESEHSDWSEEQNFYQLQALALLSQLQSGDVLTVERWRGDRAPWGTALQIVEADRVSNPYWKPDSDQITGGVEVDDRGRRIAFHVQDGHPGSTTLSPGAYKWRRVPVRGADGRRRARLLFDPDRPGQRRGVPMLAPVIEDLKQIKRAFDAELQAWVISSFLTVFVTSDSPDDDTGSAFPSAPEGVDLNRDEGQVHLGPAALMELAPGEKIETVTPNRPNQAFEAFLEALTTHIGSGLNIPYEVLRERFNSSYSASRAALLRAWTFYRMRRVRIGEQFCTPCYEAVLSEAIARGRLDAPGFFEDEFVRRAWLGHIWVGDVMPEIDPKRAVEAAEKRIEVGISNREIESMQSTGESYEDSIHPQLVKEAEMRRRDGLDPAPAAAGTATVPNPDPEDFHPDDDE